MRSRWFRPTLRTRLTLIYGGLFLVAGGLLVGLSYVFVSHSIATPGKMSGVAPVRVQFSQAPVRLPDGNLGYRLADGRVVTAGEFKQELQNAVQAAVEQQRADTLRSLVQQSTLALGLVAVAALGAGWLVAGRALRPLHVITDTARRVADRSLHERIALDGPADELKELADTFDGMLGRLDRAFEGQSRFVANASHELRTPLAVNRTLLEVAMTDPDASADLRQVGAGLLAVNERSERLIDGLLLLARSDQAIADRRPVDLADAARHAVAQLAAEASAADVTVRPRGTTAVALGDPVLLERLVTNLVENAIRHNTAGGWAEVVTGRAPGTGDAQVVVANTGAPVPPYEVDGLFEPFRRGRERLANTGGSGLGLSIVRSIATAHGGSVSAEPRPGGGLVVRVTLPTTVPAGTR